MRKAPGGVEATVIRICCTGAVLAVLLAVLRARILLGSSELRSPARMLRALTLGAYADFAFVAGLTGAFIALALLAGGRSGLRRLALGGFLVAASLSLLLGFVNVRAVAELGRPVNYQWLYYSHFMRSIDTYTALAALLSWDWAARVAVACLALMVASHLLTRGTIGALRRVGARPLGAAAAVGMSAYFTLGWTSLNETGWKPTALENPVVALVASALNADDDPVLTKMPTRVGPEDFLSAGARGALAPRTSYTARARDAGVRNVVVVVLESVAAQYLPAFGAADSSRTPELERARHSMRRFANFYAHQPSTTHSLVALLLSVYPPHTFRVVTREHPDIALPSLSGELKRRGYRTATINAEDNRFQRADEFLAHRRFDLITDARAGSCALPDEGSDACMMDALARWIDQDTLRPFFALLLTAQTHWPYRSRRPRQDGGATSASNVGQRPPDSLRARFGRYVGALWETDRALGQLFGLLEDRRLLDSTLIVVSGDHGEAFGQHDNAFHRFLYEEEVHVPLFLINARLFHGEIDSVPGGTIDLAPTVMDLLGHPVPAEWQGQSLFDPLRHGRVYLYGPYSGLFGYREGARKFIYDAIANEDELYDLALDPAESLNIAQRHPEEVQEGRERLAAWVQYLDRFYRQQGVAK